MSVFGLDSMLEPTGTVFPSQTKDSLGSFDVSANLTEGFIEVTVQGPFYDELTSKLSDTSIVLRALAAAEPDANVKVNLLTTVSKNRVRYLVRHGQAFDAAVAQAEHEVLSAFGIADDGLAAFTAMDITGSTASDAALIAVSAILLQYAGDHSDSEGQKVARLALTVSDIASDLEEDGELNGDGQGIASAAVRLDVGAVTANLKQIYSGLGLSLSVPDIEPFVTAVADPSPWQFATSMPIARAGHCACAVDDKIYVLGGAAGASLDDVMQYDTATGHWAPKAKLQVPRAYAACSVVDGMIYVTGGYTSDGTTDAVEAYDPAHDTWTTRAAMPRARAQHSSAALDGKIYVLGGQQDQPIDNVDVYDPAQDHWKPVSPLPKGLLGLAAAAVSGKLYAFGGYLSDGTSSAAAYEYDPITDTWTLRAPMRAARGAAAAVALGGRIYLVGGANGTTILGDVDAYDPITDAWTEKTSMNVPRAILTGVTSGDLAYLIGGIERPATPTAGGRDSEAVETYDPAKDN